MVSASAGLRIALVVVLAACALLPTSGLGAQGLAGGMIVASSSEAVGFHPYKTTDTASGAYQHLVYTGGLLERDPQNVERFVGNLAERWEVSADRLTYTFTLRPDLQWSDGQPLTAFDFAWTYQQASRPENGWPYAANLEPIVSYAATDARTIVVRLAEAVAVGLEQADPITPLPKHVWEHLDWNDLNRNPEILAPSVGSGPFLLSERLPLRYTVFVPNPRYFKGRPKLTHYTVMIAPPGQSGYSLLRSGVVDRASPEPADYALATRLEGITVYDWWPATGNWTYISFNMRQPVVQDVRVRQALAHAMNREAIIEQVLHGLARPVYSTFGPSCWCYNPDVPRRDFDLARARELLDEAGFRPGPDGIRIRDGQPLRLRLLYGPLSNIVREQIARMARDNFRQIGVDLQVVGMDWGAYLAALKTPPFAWDLNLGGWAATIDPHWMYQIWSEDQIPSLNHGAYRNPAIEELFQQGAREFDQETRRRIYGEIQRILAEDQAYIFLYGSKAYEAVSNRIGGIRPSPQGLGWNIHEWYVK